MRQYADGLCRNVAARHAVMLAQFAPSSAVALGRHARSLAIGNRSTWAIAAIQGRSEFEAFATHKYFKLRSCVE
jgi:hypothetical protein